MNRWLERRKDDKGPKVSTPQLFLVFSIPFIGVAAFAIWEGIHAFSENVGFGLLLVVVGVVLSVVAVLLPAFLKPVFKGWHIGGRAKREDDIEDIAPD